MIAKIGRGMNIYGVLAYNQTKVTKQKGEVLLLNNMLETPDGSYTVAKLLQSFEPYLLVNNKTEKPVLHISLNPDPRDKVSDEQYKLISEEYMHNMGYGGQPYVVFKHTDTSRAHIHIVSVCVDENGKKISDTFERRRSMDVCRALEKEHHLIPATEKGKEQDDWKFRPVDYKAGDIKSQIAIVVRYLPKYYQFQSMGAYNALLSLFSITTEEVKGEVDGRTINGLVYFALNDKGEKISNPFKSSFFGKSAGIAQLQTHFELSKETMKTSPSKDLLKNAVEIAFNKTFNETDFRNHITVLGINIVVRRNAEGRVYGITFIDHQSKSVWNGSQLGKNFSANVFNERWKNQVGEPDGNTIYAIAKNASSPLVLKPQNISEATKKPHELFDFLHKDNFGPSVEFGLNNSIGGILPETQGEDYEELTFEQQVRKRKKGKKRT